MAGPTESSRRCRVSIGAPDVSAIRRGRGTIEAGSTRRVAGSVRPCPTRQRGAIYLLLLFIVAVTGAALASLGQAWSTDAQRGRESELLWVGATYRNAIARYYEATPGPVKSFPPSLDSLLLDPRFPDRRRHLRQLLPDPITGQFDWVVIAAPMGGIMGLASRSESPPLKRSGFEGLNRPFEEVAIRLQDQLRYRDWEFIHTPGSATD